MNELNENNTPLDNGEKNKLEEVEEENVLNTDLENTENLNSIEEDEQTQPQEENNYTDNESKIDIENEDKDEEISKQNLEEEKKVNFNVKENEYISRKSFNKLIILGIIFSIILSTLTGVISVSIANKTNSEKVVVYKDTDANPVSTTVSESKDLSDVVDQIAETVVEVYTEKAAYNSFYGQYVTEGAGSGVIYSSDGYILTNNHVIESATSIKVKTTDGNEYEATLVATDSVSDIAVIKINAEGLKPAILGSSASLRVGESCIAIGNPLGTLGGSVTTGIISALSREISIDGQKMTLLQTNTSISPGNSGGGLFDYNGLLIAIVNAKNTGDGIEGIGFAIPIDYVKDIAEQLITKGYVTGRPAIGISCTSIETMQQAWNYGVSTYGVYINELVGENAKNSGLAVGDVIVGIDDTAITKYADLKSTLNTYSAGDEITIKVVRNNQQMQFKLVLEQKQN